jgi:hypothetical protein
MDGGSIDVSLARSKALHEAVARYSVGISRMVPVKKEEKVASKLTHAQAKAMQAALTTQLAREEPQWQGCMCRSLATVELSNKADVARVLGYGPDFSYEASVTAVEAFLRNEAQREDLTHEEEQGLRDVTAAFVAACS